MEYLVGLVIGEHSVKIKCNSQLFAVVICISGSQYLTGWMSLCDRLTHVVLIRRQEQRHVQAGNEYVRRPSLGKNCSRDTELVMIYRTHHSEAGVRIIVRHDYYLDKRVVRTGQVVQRKQPLNERESDSWHEWIIQMLFLVTTVTLFAFTAEYGIRFIKAE